MLKKIIGVGIAIATIAPFALSAATFSNVAFENGDVTISGKGGSTVNATLHIVVPANQVVERIQTDVLSDSLAPVCTEVGGDQGLQEGTYDVTIPVKLPPNTGTYSLAVQGSGIFGGFRTVDCANDVVGTATFSNSLRVVAGSDSSGNFAGSGMSLADLIAALKAAGVQVGSTTPAPATSAVCTEYAGLSAGISFGSDSRPGGRVGKLQSFLMYKGFDIPLLSSNQAPYGYFGNQSASASASFKAVNNCI